MFKKSLDYGQAGDNIGALLRGVKREDVTRGQILAQPNTVKTYKKFLVRCVTLRYIGGCSVVDQPLFSHFKYSIDCLHPIQLDAYNMIY